MKGVSKIYVGVGVARPIVRPSSNDIKRKPNRARKLAHQERENRQALKRARLYLKEALIEREDVERLILKGLKKDPGGRRLDFRLKNLTNRAIDLQAAIRRLGGEVEEYSISTSQRLDSRSGTAREMLVQRDTGEELDDNSNGTSLEDIGVPLPSERQKPEGLIYDLREGQYAFREKILAAYGHCALTGCRDREALQAAHIIPYVDVRSNLISNGICLRADIHQLFDRELIRIEVTYRVTVATKLHWGEYRLLEGRELLLPPDAKDWPNKRLLSLRQRLFAPQSA